MVNGLEGRKWREQPRYRQRTAPVESLSQGVSLLFVFQQQIRQGKLAQWDNISTVQFD